MERIGPFEVASEVARDAAGRKLLARDTRSDTVVELRTFEPAPGLDPDERQEALECFLAAARVLSSVRHPGLVHVADYGEIEGLPYSAQERVEGTPLAAFVREETLLPSALAVELIAAAADAVAAAHEAGLVHGNLRPSALLRMGGSGLRITGFGADRSLGRESNGGDDPGYGAPEIARGRSAVPASDLFSLCAVLYELLTGVRPFAGREPATVLYRIVHEEPTSPVRGGEPIAPGLAAVILRGLAKEPAARPASGASLAAELRSAAAQLEVAQEPATAPGPNPPASEPTLAPSTRRVDPARRGGALPFVALAFVLVGGVGGAAYVFRERLTPEPAAPPVVWLESVVRTVPEGLPVTLDGQPLEPAGRVRFAGEGPFGVLATSFACRTVEQPIDPSAAGGEIVLVADPVELELPVDPGLAGVDVRLNGAAVGQTPLKLKLDLCRENRVQLHAERYRPVELTLAAGATPLDARKAIFAVELEPIPMGRLQFARTSMQLVYYLDGKRLGVTPGDLELEAGDYTLRYKNEYHFLEGQQKIEIAAGEALTPQLSGLELATLTVQAFPSNCKAWARRPGGEWKFIDETPASRRVGLGAYEVKIMLNPTGEEQVRRLELSAGSNPPLRVSFGRRG